jgi:hypothetical protein
LGATIALDYVRAGNTPNMPQNRWVMASAQRCAFRSKSSPGKGRRN